MTWPVAALHLCEIALVGGLAWGLVREYRARRALEARVARLVLAQNDAGLLAARRDEQAKKRINALEQWRLRMVGRY